MTKIRNEFVEIIKNPNTQIIQKNYTFGNFASEEMKIELLKIKDSDPHYSGTDKEMQLEIISNGKNIM